MKWVGPQNDLDGTQKQRNLEFSFRDAEDPRFPLQILQKRASKKRVEKDIG